MTGPVLPLLFQYLLSTIFALASSFAVTPLIIKTAVNAGVIDIPKDERRVHLKPVPKLGGLAIAVGFFSGILLNVIFDAFNLVRIMPQSNQLLGFLIGLAIIIIMGSLDDLYDLKPMIKFIFQFAAAGVVVFSGTKIATFTNPFSEEGYSFLHQHVSIIISLLWIVGLTNAINFIDGLDGLAAGVTAIGLVSLFCVSILTGTPQILPVSLFSCILFGAIIGFMPYNNNPARIFMSDVGANFLGFALGVITVQGATKSYAAIALALPITILALPLFDVIYAIFRRLLNKKSITDADRGHIHHRLIDLGFSHKKTVLLLYIASASLGVIAVVLALLSGRTEMGKVHALYAMILIMFLITVFAGVVFVLKTAHRKKKP